ncbi:MAG: tetraacyldisaccharide 4'-kinase [Myxococcales bacterium]|jgi:tetraacyldisaccharide 4'-kinase|nr:tetraacyldisaccharide 4'-kinase [Myxococcales bacterium]
MLFAVSQNSLRSIISLLWLQRDESLFRKLLLFPLWILSLFVALVVRQRRVRLSPLAHRVSARVISVGNIAVGGTGKTPVTIELGQRLVARGRRVAILSRGYGRKETEPLVVSDGTSILATAEEGGDEPIVIAQALPSVPVLVGQDRAALADMAIERFGCEFLLLDDGFQHLKLARDVDIVLFDGSNPFGNGHLIPRGPLREGKSALRHANLTWITKLENARPGEVEALAAQLESMTGRPPIFSTTRVRDVTELSGESLGTKALAGARVFLACGLARPEAFHKTVQSLGATIVGEALFDDHHTFCAADLASIEARARALGAETIAITAKDAAKIQAIAQAAPDAFEEPLSCRVVVVHVQLEIVSGSALLDEVLAL